MKTVHFNGEYWYEKHDTLWKRIKTWVCWKPGPELTPLSILGHRVTLMPFGLDIKLRGHRCLCIHIQSPHVESAKDLIERFRAKGWKALYVYLSPDGTPSGATLWLWNPPGEVATMAKNREAPDSERAARGSYDCRSYPPYSPYHRGRS